MMSTSNASTLLNMYSFRMRSHDVMQFFAYGRATWKVYFFVLFLLFLCIALLIIITYYCRTDNMDTPPEVSFCGEIPVYQICQSDAT